MSANHNHHHELSQLITGSGKKHSDEYNNKNISTTVCRFFKNGKCLSGKNCKFSHDLNSSEQQQQQQQHNHHHHHHNYTHNNNYSHNHNHNDPITTNNNNNNSNNTACKYFAAGYCKSASKCAFQHTIIEPLNTNHNINCGTTSTINNTLVVDQKKQNLTPNTSSPNLLSTTINLNTNNNSNNNNTNFHNISPLPKVQNEINTTDNSSNNIKTTTFTSIPTTIINGFPIPTLPILETINNNNHHYQHFNSNLNSPLTPKTLQSSNIYIDDNTSFNGQFRQQQLSPHTQNVDIIQPPHHHHNNNNNNNNSNILVQQQQLSKSPLLNQTGSIALSPTRNLQFTNSLSFLPNSPRNSGSTAVLSSSPSSPFSPQLFQHSSTVNGPGLLSSSPSPFFAAPIPIGGYSGSGLVNQQQQYDHQYHNSSTAIAVMVDDDEDEDDDDDNVQLNDPSGLIIIDDNYDDNVFDPFEYREIDSKNYIRHSEEILYKQEQEKQEFNSNNNNNNKNSDDEDENNIDLEIKNLDINNNNSDDNEKLEDGTSQPQLSYLDALKLNIPVDYYISYEGHQGGSNNNYRSESTLTYQSSTNGIINKSEILCHFFIQGVCRNGETCKYVHGNHCQVCTKPMLIPGHKEQNEYHLTECLIAQEKQIQREEMKHLECGICFDSIVDRGRRFGLLSHCNHVFCLECIREWRGTNTTTTSSTNNTPQSQSNSIQTSVRLCPMCRINSHFIIPADIFVGDEKKQEIIEIYKSKLSTIPCKYFNKGKGTCKFGTSCMYAHLNPDGTLFKPQLRKATTSYGDVTIHSNQLGMFLPNSDEEQDSDEEDNSDDDSNDESVYKKEGFEFGCEDDNEDFSN